MGGNSAERSVSLKSGEAVYQALKNQHIDCFKFDLHGNNIDALWTQKFDQAFIALHGRGGEDGSVQKQLEKRGIAYTGSNSSASKKCIDKAKTKAIWQQHNLPVAPAVIAHIGQPTPDITFSLPWAVKPVLEGSSFGVSKVENLPQLESALNLAFKYDDVVLIEKWIQGNEYTVSILNAEALPVVQIQVDQGFYDYQSKYLSNATRYLCPCDLSSTDARHLQKIALQAFEVMGAKTWGRIDLILDKNKQPFLLEINTIPGMTSHSLLPMAAKVAGLSFDELVLKIIKGNSDD